MQDDLVYGADVRSRTGRAVFLVVIPVPPRSRLRGRSDHGMVGVLPNGLVAFASRRVRFATSMTNLQKQKKRLLGTFGVACLGGD